MSKIWNKYVGLPDAIKASFWFTICSILQKGIAFITVPIFTRMLTPAEYGVTALFGSWQSIIIIFATLNLSYQVFNNGMVKYEQDQSGYTTAMLGLSNLTTLLLFSIYLIFHTRFNIWIGLPTSAMLMMFIGFFFSAAVSLWTVEQRYLYKYKLLCIITLLTTLGAAIFSIVLVYFQPIGLSKILGGTIATIGSGLLVYLLLLKKSRKLFSREYWKFALKLDIPLIPHYLSMSVLGSSDRIMINSMCGKAATALYSVPYTASMVMQIVVNSICASFIPWTYQKCKMGEYEKLNELSSILLLLVMTISLLPSLFAPELVWILGSHIYRDSAWVVPPVSCSVFFMFLYGLFANIELYYGRTRNIMLASIIAAGANVILNYIFISLFGYLAAAYTTLACYILLSVAHYCFMKNVCREQGIRKKIYNMKLICIISAFLVFYSIVITTLFDKPFWIRYLLIALIFIGLYYKKNFLREKLMMVKKSSN